MIFKHLLFVVAGSGAHYREIETGVNTYLKELFSFQRDARESLLPSLEHPGFTQRQHEGTVDDLPIHLDAAGTQEIASRRRILHQPRLIKDRGNRHILGGRQLDLRQVFRQLAILQAIAGRLVRARRRLLAMEAGDDLFGQLDLDVARIGARLDILAEAIDLIQGTEAEQLEVNP